jgi:hypothetical protein
MFGALKSDSTHHFFRNACTKAGSLRFSQFSGCWLILSNSFKSSTKLTQWSKHILTIWVARLMSNKRQGLLILHEHLCSLPGFDWACDAHLFSFQTLSRNERGRFGALKSDSTHHFFRNACTKAGSLRFSQFSGCWLILSVYILMSFD